jgi:hypothetical protein
MAKQLCKEESERAFLAQLMCSSNTDMLFGTYIHLANYKMKLKYLKLKKTKRSGKEIIVETKLLDIWYQEF